MNSKRLMIMVWVWLAMLVGLGGFTPAYAQSKIGFVNLDRILRDAPPAVRAQKKIEGEFSKRDQELTRQTELLKKAQDAFQRNAPTMSESDRRNKEREVADLDREFQRRQREFREDLNQRRNEELAGVLELANRAVRRIAESEKYDIIFQEAVWVDPKNDITDRVIRALDDSKPAAK